MRLEAMRGGKGTAEAGGLLLGSVEWDGRFSVMVDDVEPVNWSYSMSPGERRDLEAVLARHAAGGRSRVVGYYRTHSRDDLFLNAGDLVLIKSYFPDPSNIFLLLKAGSGEALLARLFFHQGGSLRSEGAEPAFPFGRPACPPEAAEAEPDALTPVLAPAPALVPASPPVAPAAAPPPAVVAPAAPAYEREERERQPMPRGSKAWLWSGLAVAAVAAALYLSPARQYLPEWRMRPVAAPAPLGGQQLGLQVEKRLNDLLLRWDRNAPAINRAQRAVLNIHDGIYIRPYQLDLDQLRTGSVYYTPLSGDVQFRLEVYDEANRASVESIRVLSATALPPPAAILPGLSAADLAGLPPSGRETARPPARPRPATEPAPVSTADRSSADRTAYLQFTPRPEPAKPVTLDAPPPDLVQDRARVALAAAPGIPGLHPSVTVTAPARAAQSAAPAPSPAAPQPQSAAPGIPPAASQPAPSAAPVRLSSYVGPAPLKQVQPTVPQSVRGMLKSEVELSVRVYIDQEGKVTRAELVGQRGPLSGFVTEAALNAARRWRFRPAWNSGRYVSSDMLLNFRFMP